jgi:hypothetical protein
LCEREARLSAHSLQVLVEADPNRNETAVRRRAFNIGVPIMHAARFLIDDPCPPKDDVITQDCLEQLKQSRTRGDIVEQAVGRAKRLASPALVAARVEAMVLENELALRRRQQTDRRDETVAVKRGCFRGGRYASPHRFEQAIAKGPAAVDHGAERRGQPPARRFDERGVQRFLPGMRVTEFRLRRSQGVLASLACRKRLFQSTDTVEKGLLLMRLGRWLRHGGRYVTKFPQFFDRVMTAQC